MTEEEFNSRYAAILKEYGQLKIEGDLNNVEEISSLHILNKNREIIEKYHCGGHVIADVGLGPAKILLVKRFEDC